jgi:YVTN family beta-propeller protein
MYVTNFQANTVSVIDTTTNTVIDTIPVGESPLGITYNPVNHIMYVANFFGDTVSGINLSPRPEI